MTSFADAWCTDMSIQHSTWTRDSVWPTIFGSRAATRQTTRTLKMLVDLEPVRVNGCTLSGRERKRVAFVHSDRFRHLVIPRTNVRTHEVEDTLQRGYQNPGDVIGRVDAQLPSSCFSVSASTYRAFG